MKTIKQRISYAVMGLITMGFTACTQNEDMAPTLKGQEINATFTVGGVQTRVNTLEKGNKWENDDDLKVLFFTDDYLSESAILNFDGKTKTWSHSRLFRWKDDYSTHNILAVHPFNYDFEKYELPLEQKTLPELKSADLINGYLCQTPDWITACKHDNNQFSAIVIPDSYAADDTFLKFKLGNQSFNVKMNMDTSFKEGICYTYELKVGKNKMELTPTSIEDLSGWDSEEELKSK